MSTCPVATPASLRTSRLVGSSTRPTAISFFASASSMRLGEREVRCDGGDKPDDDHDADDQGGLRALAFLVARCLGVRLTHCDSSDSLCACRNSSIWSLRRRLRSQTDSARPDRVERLRLAALVSKNETTLHQHRVSAKDYVVAVLLRSPLVGGAARDASANIATVFESGLDFKSDSCRGFLPASQYRKGIARPYVRHGDGGRVHV